MAEVIVYYPDRYGESDPAMIEGLTIGKLVRCRDCIHYDEQCQQCERIDGIIFPDFYCADGERG